MNWPLRPSSCKLGLDFKGGGLVKNLMDPGVGNDTWHCGLSSLLPLPNPPPASLPQSDLASLYIKAGVKNVGTVFLMTDAQVADEKFLVLVNDLLASGNDRTR